MEEAFHVLQCTEESFPCFFFSFLLHSFVPLCSTDTAHAQRSIFQSLNVDPPLLVFEKNNSQKKCQFIQFSLLSPSLY